MTCFALCDPAYSPKFEFVPALQKSERLVDDRGSSYDERILRRVVPIQTLQL